MSRAVRSAVAPRRRGTVRDLARLLLALGMVLLVAGLERHAPAEVPRAAARAVGLDRGNDPVEYELEAVLDAESHEVRGRGSVRFVNRSTATLHELWLHAYLDAFRDRDTLFMREAGRGFRGRRALTHRGGLDVHELRLRGSGVDLWPSVAYETRKDRTDARIPLPTALAPGESLTLDVSFTARLPSLVLRTGFVGSFHMVAQWFPKLARLEPDGTWAHFPFHPLSEFYSDFGAYDVTVDVPEGFRVGATGAPVASSREGGRVRQRFVAERVHDFAFAAWDGFEEIRQMAGATEIVSLFPKAERAEAEIEIDVATRGLAFFGESYGAYPYKRLTIVRPPPEANEAGGMEYPTLITTGASTKGRSVGMRGIESLTLHELAHQWFYGMVGSDEHRFPMLDEGLTSYASADAMETFWPGRSAFDGLGFRASEVAALRVLAGRATEGRVTRAATGFSDGKDYVSTVYGRGATALATIARVYGRDRLRVALRKYVDDHRFGHPVPADLIAAIRESMGLAESQALEALLAGGRFDVRVLGFESHRDTRDASAWRGSVTLERTGEVSLPVRVEVRDANGELSTLDWDGRGEHVELGFVGAAPISSVRVDPDARLLVDDDLTNHAMGESPWPSRIYANLVLAAQLALEVLGP